MLFQKFTELIHPVFDADSRSNEGADDHAGQDEEQILTLNRALNPHGGQTQGNDA